MGIPYERALVAHRIIGRWVLALLAVHAGFMIAGYGTDVLSVRENCVGLGNLFGLVHIPAKSA
jgi:hypothetical protein